jgi:2'-5' RNA ligase
VSSYKEIWEKFERSRRLQFGGHTDPTWQHGHTTSASFVVPVEVSHLRERLEPVREALAPFPFVSLHPDHFMHITLLVLGFLVEEPKDKGELSHRRLTDFAERAREDLAHFPSFRVRLANLNAFPSAVFIEAHSGGKLEELQNLLSLECGMKRPTGPPHLTLAYFHTPDGSPAPEPLVSTIERFRDWPVGEVWVDRVDLTLLDLRGTYPEPQSVAKMPLVGG